MADIGNVEVTRPLDRVVHGADHGWLLLVTAYGSPLADN